MHFKTYKTILSPKNHLNLYRGCTHGCIYCDSRSDCYQFDHVFEDIQVKSDALLILENELRKKRKPAMIGTGAMTDPYMPIEKKLQLTHGALELIKKYGFGVSILTKSNQILADIDLLEEINQQTKAVIQITLTTFNEELCKKLEPNVSGTKDRIEVLKEAQKRYIPTVVWLGPILPFINDSMENLVALLAACIEVNVKGIVCFGFGVTMRSGNREYFYQMLDRLFPGMKDKYRGAFGEQYVCNSPHHQKLMTYFIETCQNAGILWRTEEVFDYLQQFETKDEQLSLF
ncbi:SPL family radical SAM protein [Enterococcus alishanensis]|uniref:Radical SAM protein n=1 Tax=Enterococcus alishanensis TaxID=1303817 RepID=A0ABS6T9T2_9ENTE|nr:radical SAM protein [Enterococcus alishanensis]MBV7389653.1 radical SAM protein [Enterococcus alishanensis]